SVIGCSLFFNIPLIVLFLKSPLFIPFVVFLFIVLVYPMKLLFALLLQFEWINIEKAIAIVLCSCVSG
ncbi:MAG: hypothetical protein ACRDDD_00845, partial [Plesiomonas sp.]|uniref:hypothetical protein n=1 Tax=Plesiomonas sp. TaxID=2486279 RepID=UPI003EE5CA5C